MNYKNPRKNVICSPGSVLPRVYKVNGRGEGSANPGTLALPSSELSLQTFSLRLHTVKSKGALWTNLGDRSQGRWASLPLWVPWNNDELIQLYFLLIVWFLHVKNFIFNDKKQ